MKTAICVKFDTPLARIGLTLILILKMTHGVICAYGAESHPGISTESLYSEAVIAFNKKQTREALRILDDLLKSNPNHLESLELMALTLKTEGNDAKAIEVYSRLIKLKPEAERGPYHFELGLIYNKQKKGDLARPQFEQAIKLHFNERTAHLFLGLLDFESSNLNKAAEHFAEVTSADQKELRVVAHYYLGMIHFKNAYGAGGTHEMTEARNLAEDLKDSKMAQDIYKAADKILAPFNTSQWFGNVTLMGQYDSNLTLLPETNAGAAPSNTGATNFLLNGGLGRMSSPLNTIQWVGSYRFSTNKNFNPDTATYEFFTNFLSLNANFRPLSRTNGGLKVEGTLTFQNSTAPSTYHIYQQAIEVGPFFRRDFTQNLQGQLEFNFRPVTNLSDPTLSGSVYNGKATFHYSSTSRYLNLTGVAAAEANTIPNVESQYNSLTLGLNDSIRISQNDTATLSLGAGAMLYPVHPSARRDVNWSAGLNVMHTLGAHMTLTADFSYLRNNSTISSSYSYSKWTAGLGVGWSL